MQIRMLGPFAVEHDGAPLKLAGPKQRAVLSLLAMRANATVPVERLIEGLWGEDPPASAPKMIQQYVSQLRRLLPEPAILTHGRGYELRIDADAVDVLRFERLVDRAAHDSDGERSRLAREALALWNGPPLADLLDEPFTAAETRHLEELHMRATELTIEGDLDAGREAEVIAPLRALVDEHPLREHPRALLMLALYRTGRQAEALDAFQDARWTLTEELGLEPGPELRRLQEAILRQDPALERVLPDVAWASRETAERLGTGVGRVSQARGALRADERDLAADVADLQHLRERTARPPAPVSNESPYKGLATFDITDVDVYFGRERLIAEMVARLPGTSLLGVIGPSGSGKSSAVRAGLLPSLGAGVLPGSEGWTRALLRPGERPLAALRRALHVAEGVTDPVAAALDAVPAGARLLLVVDQFEETFTACRDAADRNAFLDALVAPAARGDARYLAVLAVRADYYGACAVHPLLARLLGENHVLVGSMRPDELARAIDGPAGRRGVTVEAELVSRLVEETAGRPGGLPLLSTTLRELWLRRAGDSMTVASYEQTGGVHGAVARLAETAYQSFGQREAAAARHLLLRLAGDSDAAVVVRRRVPLSELDLTRSDAARRVLHVLTEKRLLTVGGDAVEVAHEALLREWPRLQQWLEEDAEARRLHRRITLAAREWDAGGRDPGELLRGARLASALDFAAAQGDALNVLEREFLDEARLVSERDALRSRRTNRQLRALLAAALAGLLAALAGGALAVDQRGEARQTARVADAERLGAQALIDDRPDRSLLLARAGIALDDSVATRGHLVAALYRQPPALLGVYPTSSDTQIFDVAISPSGNRAALASESGSVSVFALPGRRLAGIYRIGSADHLAFSPDGRTLAVAGQASRDAPSPVVDLVDARSLRRRKRITLTPDANGFVTHSPAFTADGDELLLLRTVFSDAPRRSALRRFDARTAAELGRPRSLPAGTSHRLIAGAGRVYVTGAGIDETWELDASSLRLIERHQGGGVQGVLSPTLPVIALGSQDGSVRLLDLTSGTIRRLNGDHRGEVTALAFAPDGRVLVTAADDATVFVRDVEAGTVRERFEGHARSVGALAVTPDGQSLLSADWDGQAFMWDLTGDHRLARTIALGRSVRLDGATPRGSAVSPDGSTLAVTGAGGAVDLIDTRTLAPRDRLDAGDEPVLDIAYSPDGRLLAASQVDDATGTLVWDVRTGKPTRFSTPAAATSLAFSPDGRRFVAAGLDQPVEVRDARTGRLIVALETVAAPRSAVFSPDGRLLFVGLLTGAGQFFTTADWKRSGAPVRGQDTRLTSAQFTRDGRTLTTASADGSVMLWDVASRKPIGSRMMVEPDVFMTSELSPDGRFLYAVPTGREGVRLDLSPAFWKDHACRIAGRELTEREWRDAVPRQPFRPVCA